MDDYPALLGRLKKYELQEPVARPRSDEKLRPVLRLMEALGSPERDYAIIHVAGTNGKGLSAAMTESLLSLSGCRTGLYCSPHVVDIRERISLNGGLIEPALFARAGHMTLDAAENLPETPRYSYFDLLTAMALKAFSLQGVDWAVLETGLGGRADATNVTGKKLALLTRIGMDHLHVLGRTLEEITWEKLGILRPGVSVVMAEQSPLVAGLIRQEARRLGCPLVEAGEAGLEPLPPDGPRAPKAPRRIRVRWRGEPPLELELPEEAPPLTAPRLACAANALTAVREALGRPALDREQVARWVRNALAVTLPGRLELRRNVAVRGRPGARLDWLVLDGGHNPEAVEALVAQLALWGLGSPAILLRLQSDKLVDELREPLSRLLAGAARLFTTEPSNPRSPPVEKLREYIRGLPGGDLLPPVEVAPDVGAVLAACLEHPARPLVAAGSFWMLGELLPLLEP
ncbi:MAG: hypothetical protein OEZ59_07295 [Deltaproteobacteria bacterium]|nr:hypothetical protein [Deltaproteobacteria bacterium]